MKKVISICLYLFFAFTYAQATFLEGFGFSLRTGVIKGSDNYGSVMNSFDDYWSNNGYYESGYDKSGGGNQQDGIDVFYEKAGLFGLGQKHMLGTQIGYTKYQDNHFSYTMQNFDVYSFPWPIVMRYENIYAKSEAYSIPVSVYYTYLAGRKWKFSAGTGLTFLTNKFEGYIKNTEHDTISGTTVENVIQGNPKTDSIVIPTINCGIEFLIVKYAGLYMDFGWNLSGKTSAPTQYGDVERDLSGFSFKAGLRAYLP
ncbi:MAG: hypothetical protein FWG57_04990 [Endomicrobia bacterium]|nr:hypothetical protein [Endomicrobiia bacterium]